MFEKISPQKMVQFKKLGYWFFLVPPALIPLGYWLGMESGMPNLFAFLAVFVVYGLIPVLDYIIGKDPANPDEQMDVPMLSQKSYYAILPILALPIQLAMVVWGAYVFATYDAFNLIGQLGWAMSIGVVGGANAINVGHELVHKDSRLEQWTGGSLLSLVTYAGFKVEHIRGHHVHVSTPEDASSARYNQSLYQFLPNAYVKNFTNAWNLEAKRLERKKHSPFSWRNELIWWYSISALVAVALGVAFGWMGFLFFVLQSFVAFTELEIINYVEHYGLHRRKLENGRYERCTPEHSWNSNYLLTNLFLFHLQRHSDHHANPKRRYQVLRHYDESPQLPGGYPSMVLLALVPPLWKKLINPRVESYYKGQEYQLTDNQIAPGVGA